MGSGSESRRGTTLWRPGMLAVFGASVVSWLGMFLHNSSDLPGQTVISPETLLPTLVYLLILGAWFTRIRREAAVALLAWAWLHLVLGGFVSAAPWMLDQPAHHFAVHLAYALLEVPLVVVMTAYLRSTARRPRVAEIRDAAG